MNLSELQAFLEESGWDDEPLPAHPNDTSEEAKARKARRASDYNLEIESIELSSDETRRSTDVVRPAETTPKELVVPELSLEEVVEPEPEPVAMPTQAFEDEQEAEDLEVELPMPANPKSEKPVKLVPKLTNIVHSPEPELRASDTVKDRLKEIEMAQKMGYFTLQMFLATTDYGADGDGSCLPLPALFTRPRNVIAFFLVGKQVAITSLYANF